MAARAADTEKSTDYIDAHVHVWTPDIVRFPHDKRRDGKPVPPVSFTPEQLLALAKPGGVSRIVLIQMSFYGTDNSYMLDAMKRYPAVFSGVGILDHQAPRVRDEMIRLEAFRVRGYRITPGVGTATWLDSPGMQAMWRCGAEKRIAMCPLIGPDAIDSVSRMCAKAAPFARIAFSSLATTKGSAARAREPAKASDGVFHRLGAISILK